MPDDMGSFRTTVEFNNPAQPERRHTLHDVLVDTGAELSWLPKELLEDLGIRRLKIWRFRQADGTVLSRWTGTVELTVEQITTADEVVFGEAHDLVLLGARTLEGLNLCIDPVRKILVDAGPAPAAAVA